jgi:hypothetical protein
MDPMYIILIVKIRNVLNVNRLGDYMCVPDTCRLTELETIGNDSCSIPEEEEEEVSVYTI